MWYIEKYITLNPKLKSLQSYIQCLDHTLSNHLTHADIDMRSSDIGPIHEVVDYARGPRILGWGVRSHFGLENVEKGNNCFFTFQYFISNFHFSGNFVQPSSPVMAVVGRMSDC